jgi:hypothetical protein|tara:strand:+ start:401 stop:1333 length:933 start_codon:yes stop_codon:yes gene_type:complete
MKKILGILVLGLLFCNISFADYYKLGQIIENEFRFSKKIKFNLEPGKWTVIEKGGWFYGNIQIRFIGIVLIRNNEIVSFKEFQEGKMGAKFQAGINISLHEYFYLDKYDGCYQRTEYTLVKKYSKGSSNNCLVIKHLDLNKALYNPDNPNRKIELRHYRKWIEDNNIKIPSIMLQSWHAYFSRLTGGTLYTVGHYDNPKFFDGPKYKFSTEDTSEYHPSNIKRYPKFNKYMNNFIKISAKRHVDFENTISAKSSHKLDFIKMGIEIKNIPKVKKLDNDNFIKQVYDLKKLLDDGVITDEEFTKAKKKLLN